MVTIENYDKNGKRIEDLTKVTVDIDTIPGLKAAIEKLVENAKA